VEKTAIKEIPAKVAQGKSRQNKEHKSKQDTLRMTPQDSRSVPFSPKDSDQLSPDSLEILIRDNNENNLDLFGLVPPSQDQAS